MAIAERKDRESRSRAHDQRERILDAARRIVMREGLAALSMRKIAEAIGYSPASLYIYFEGRDEIAEALGREGYEQLLAQLKPLANIADARERLHAIAHAYVAYGCDHPRTYELIFMAHKERGPRAMRQRALPDAAGAPEEPAKPACGAQLLAATLSGLEQPGGMHADCGLLAQALWAMLHGVVMLTLAPNGFERAAHGPVIDAALDAWFGIRAAPGEPPAVRTPGAGS
ncbi:MAG: TetR/AcrR family transcriptional regulator [Paraburkholderia sp.]|nr:TetR/AcrR family transcriptional regulator [Paraburkholderia sp.]